MIALLSLALLAQYSDPALLPGERPKYCVRDYVRPVEDCDAKTCDLSPAFERLFAATDAAPAPAGARPPGAWIEIPPGEWRLSKPITLAREHTLRGAGGAGWGAPTLLRVKTSTHGIVVKPLAAWAEISGLALIADVPSAVADRHGIVLQARAHVHDVWVRGFTVGVYALGDVRAGTNANGARLEHLRLDLQEYAGVYLLGDNAGAIVLDAVDVGSGCRRGLRWAAAFQGRPCAGIMDYSMMGATIVGGMSADARDTTTTPHTWFANYHLRRTSALGAYSEQIRAPTTNELEVDAVSVGGTLSAYGMASGLGLRFYGPRVYGGGLWVAGTPAVGDTLPPEIRLGGSGQPPGTVLTLLPPQAGSTFPSAAALRTKLDTTPGKRGWRTDLQNYAPYTKERVLVEPGKMGVTTIRTSTAIVP